jgi:hypothetical protein
VNLYSGCAVQGAGALNAFLQLNQRSLFVVVTAYEVD